MNIPGKVKIENMGRNDQNNGKREQNQLINKPILLCKEKNHPTGKQQKWYRTPVMPHESMTQGGGPDYKSQGVMLDSNQKLWMILTPKIDRPDRKRGNTTQCIEKAIEAPIPIKSALLHFMNDLQR